MKKSVMKKLVKALRSGEYDQGKSQLVTINPDGSENFCCLGVLCNLATESGYGEWKGCSFFDEEGEESETYLPEGVAKWAGMNRGDGFWALPNGATETLTNLNDGGKSFAEIADIIEKHYEEI